MGKIRTAKIALVDLDLTGFTGRSLDDVLEGSSDPNERWRFEVALFHRPSAHEEQLEKIFSDEKPDVVFLVLPRELRNRCAALLKLFKIELGIRTVILVSETQEPKEMFNFLRDGADEFIPSPIETVNVLPRLWRLLEHSSDEMVLRQELRSEFGLRQMIGQSPAWTQQVNKIPLIAKSEANVLINGETGTGKELCARAIHYLSLRARMPFVPVNCGAIPENLFENELFGHAKGAFTDAQAEQVGLLQEADGGTLFLDEIHCLTSAAQVKLLRFVQEREYRPLGSPKPRRADVRLIAATNVNLENALQTGRLRQDLYYRINVVQISLPTLRDRADDIPLLARHFLKKHASRLSGKEMDFTPTAMELLRRYDWPGNVRELEHIIERAVVFCEDNRVDIINLGLRGRDRPTDRESFQQAKARTIAEFEKNYIGRLLLDCNGNISRAARAAQKNRRAFWELMRKHQIHVQEKINSH